MKLNLVKSCYNYKNVIIELKNTKSILAIRLIIDNLTIGGHINMFELTKSSD